MFVSLDSQKYQGLYALPQNMLFGYVAKYIRTKSAENFRSIHKTLICYAYEERYCMKNEIRRLAFYHLKIDRSKSGCPGSLEYSPPAIHPVKSRPRFMRIGG